MDCALFLKLVLCASNAEFVASQAGRVDRVRREVQPIIDRASRLLTSTFLLLLRQVVSDGCKL